MAAIFDVAARLAEGRPAVSDFENYVWACHALGYQNPHLTVHSAQIRDLYGTEDGLDLKALDADGAALSGLASLAEEALRTQSESMVELFGAWEGQAARAAHDYLRRHQDAADAVSAAVRVAVGALSELRDQLWQVVDAKVDAVLAIEDRASPDRAEWLAAAHTVLAGGGDRATASETVDQHLRPFVETAIGSDWVSAARASTALTAAAYDTAIAAMRTDPFTSFEVPGYLGPALGGQTPLAASASPAVFTAPAGAAVAAAPFAAAPFAAQAAPVAPPPVAVDPMPPASPSVAPSVAPPVESAMPPSMPPLGDLGGMSGLGGGMAGFVRQLADGIGDLAGAGRDAMPDDLALERPDVDDAKDDQDDPLDEDDDEGEDEDDDAVDAEKDEEVDADEVKEGEAESDPTTPEPAATPAPEPLSAELAPHPHVVPELPAEPPERTPCEIAADEVPQVGE